MEIILLFSPLIKLIVQLFNTKSKYFTEPTIIQLNATIIKQYDSS